MEIRGFEPIKDGVTILNTFIEEENYRDDFAIWAADNGYTVEGDCAYENGVQTETLYGYATTQMQYEVDDFWYGLQKANEESSYIDYYVVTGSLGLWNGRHSGICETFDNLFAALSKCSADAYDIVVKYENNALHFEAHHHDGTNIFEIRNLSYDDYYKVKYWEDTDGDVFDYIKKHAKPISWEMLGK